MTMSNSLPDEQENSDLITLKVINKPAQFEIEIIKPAKSRPKWGRGIEFLMSCLSLSVGLGNIWRFPFKCYENGGALFVIPYLIILFFVGKPFYFLDMVLGQFTSRGSMKAVEVVPLLKGVGWGQQIASFSITTYYTSIIGLCLTYMIKSVSQSDAVPWAECQDGWNDCYNASQVFFLNHTTCPTSIPNLATMKNTTKDDHSSSSELYLSKIIKQSKDNVVDGLGDFVPILVLTLLVSWICVYVSIIKGIRSSGKVAYVLAILPFVILFSLLIFACRLDGAILGIKAFLIPETWSKLIQPSVWYEAVVQCFYSLTIGMGSIIMFSSYNEFDHNIYRDATIVSVMDTFSSMLSGFTIFAILGNLHCKLGFNKDFSELVKSPSALAFVAYPEVIAKIENRLYFPQILSFTFFTMLFVLGVGSTVGLMNNLSTNLKDYFPNVRYWLFAGVASMIGFLIGLLYVTQGGGHMVDLVDYFGGSFLLFALATVELIGVVWVYGIQEFCWDIEFMLKRKMSPYWRISWAIVMPCFLIFMCGAAIFKAEFPAGQSSYTLFGGWSLFIFGCAQVPLWICYLFFKTDANTLRAFAKYLTSLNPAWGPANASKRKEWILFKEAKRRSRETDIANHNLFWIGQKWWELTGKFK